MNVHDRANQYATASLVERLTRMRQADPVKPRNYRRPPYDTREYNGDFARGWISEAELDADRAAHEAAALARQHRAERARSSQYATAAAPSRHSRKAPKPTRQYANPMSVEAIHDDRLTMGAKALLVLIRARCGKGVRMEATKYALALTLNRSTRTIQRYLSDLVRFGYLTTKTRFSPATGLYTGLFIRITDKVTPFFAKSGELAKWMVSKGLSCLEAGESLVVSEETELSSKNQIKRFSSMVGNAFGLP